MKKLNAVESEAQGEAVLDSKALEAIGRALRAHYDDLVHAPLPDKLSSFSTVSKRKSGAQMRGKRRNASE